MPLLWPLASGLINCHHMRLTPILLLAVVSTALNAQASDRSTSTAEARAQRIEHSLKRAIRVTGLVDSTFSLADRMKYWHVPGVSIAIVDDNRIVYARGP